jgi:hypothetical membrane protein
VRTRKVLAAAGCWLVAGAVYLSLEAIAAAAVPGYRYAHDFISDLGQPDSPLSPLMNTAFVVQGVLFFAAAVLLARATGLARPRLFLCCAAANAIGNVVVASVPSGSAGIAPVHLTGAVVAIVGGNLAILAGARFTSAVAPHPYYRAVSLGLATLGLLSFVLLAVASITSTTVGLPNAVWERSSVYTIIGWQVLSALQLSTRRRDRS